MDLLWGGVIGILASLSASWMFWRFQYQRKPQIEISEQIAKTKADGSFEYRIKIRNRSRRPAVDLQLSAYIDTLVKVETGEVHKLRSLELKSSPGFMLPKYDKHDGDHRYCRRLRFLGDVDAEWENDQVSSIVVRLFARDGESGAFDHFERAYPTKAQIIEGEFMVGDTFEIKPPRSAT